MTYPYEVLIRGTSLGFGTIESRAWRAGDTDTFPIALFCFLCGEVWARCIPHGSTARWSTYNNVCDICGIGTLWWRYEREHTLALPTQALEREFLLAFADYERWELGCFKEYPGGFQAGIRSELILEDF